MAENKKSIIVYADWYELFETLTDDEAGRLIKHFFRYVNDENPTAPDRITELSFIPIKQSLKRDLDKWDKIKEKRSLAGKASAEKRKQNATNPTHVKSVEQTPTNPTVSVSDNVSVSVNDNVIKNKEYSDEIKNFTHSIFKYFPLPPKKAEDWYKITDELIRLDKYNLESIKLIVETFTAEGHFWKKNFQSYSKLRKTNPDKIKYVDFFKNTLIAEKNGKDIGGNKKKQGASLSEVQAIMSKHFD